MPFREAPDPLADCVAEHFISSDPAAHARQEALADWVSRRQDETMGGPDCRRLNNRTGLWEEIPRPSRRGPAWPTAAAWLPRLLKACPGRQEALYKNRASVAVLLYTTPGAPQECQASQGNAECSPL